MLIAELKRENPYRSIQWKTIEGIFHRYYGQAYTCWHNNGQKSSEEYLVNGEWRREPGKGPTITVWRTNGQKSYENY